MTNKEKKQFARRFSLDDWQWLCAQMDFLDALEKSEAEAEVVAHRMLAAERIG